MKKLIAISLLSFIGTNVHAFSYVIYHGSTRYLCWETYNPFTTHCAPGLSGNNPTGPEVSSAQAQIIVKNGTKSK